MSSSAKTSIPGSNPAVQIPGSNPALQVQGSNPALQVQGSNPALQVQGSNPALQVQGSNPSLIVQNSNPSLVIQSGNPSFSGLYAVTTKKKSIFLPVFITVLLIITVVMVGAGVFKSTRDIRNAKNDAEMQNKAALEVKHINAQSTMDSDDADDIDAPIVGEVENIDFFLYSTPSNADVYCDGEFISQTPVSHKFVKKENEKAHIVVVQEGYEVLAFDVPLDQNFSNDVALNQIVVEQPRENTNRPRGNNKKTNQEWDDVELPQ